MLPCEKHNGNSETEKIMGIFCPVFRLANVHKDQQLFLEGVSSENVVYAFVL